MKPEPRYLPDHPDYKMLKDGEWWYLVLDPTTGATTSWPESKCLEHGFVHRPKRRERSEYDDPGFLRVKITS